jgi:DNA invertase Pin-like site-specific DNA recombinase
LIASPGASETSKTSFRARGAVLKATEQPIDTGTAAGKCFLDMLGVFAEFETNLRRERQLEGIAKGEGGGPLQGPGTFDRAVAGARDEGSGHAAG